MAPGASRPATPPRSPTRVYVGGLSVGYLLLLTIGVLQIGSEYRHKTISGTFLATPKRLQAMLAKVVALLGIGAHLRPDQPRSGSVSVGAVVLTPARPGRLPVHARSCAPSR